jgi:hypothetical protein
MVYNGYVYEIGGQGGSYSILATVEYAPINSNGTLGTWATTTSLPTGTEYATSMVYNGYVYEIGGETPSTYENGIAVNYTVINNGGPGTLQSWTTDTANPLPQALYGAASVTYDGYIYELGGCGSTNCPSNNVYYAPISNTGTIGTWTADTSLSTGAFTNARSGLSAVAYNGYLYIIGGGYGSSGSITYTSGSGNWTAPAGVTSVQVQAWGGGGGGGGGGYGGGGGGGGEFAAEPTLAVTPGNSYSYTVGAAGTAGSSGNGGSGGISSFAGNSVTVTANGGVGGTGGSTSSDPGGSGGSGSTNTTHHNGGAGGNTYLTWDTGGGGGGAAGSTTVGGNGTSGSTSQGAAGGSGGATGGGPGGQAAVVPTHEAGYAPTSGPGGGGGGTSFTTGGAGWAGQITLTWTGTYYNDIQYAAINSNGSLSAPSTCPGGMASGNSIWCEATAFTTARQGLSAVVNNGYLYIAGGQAGSSAGGCTATGDYCNDVQYDQVNSNGSVGGTWTDDTSLSSGAFTTARDYQGSLVYDGSLYIIGGNANGTDEGDVQYASISSNGSLSKPSGCPALASGNSIWCETTAFPNARQGLSAVAYDGYLYISGGQASASSGDCTATSDYCNGVYYAPISNNGSLGGVWTLSTVLPQALSSATASVYNGYVYELGGTNGTTRSTVYYDGVNSIPRVGQYSMLVNLGNGVNVTPDAIVVNGTNTGNPGTGGLAGLGGMTIQYENGTATCSTLSAPTTVNLGPQEMGAAYNFLFTKDGCGNTTNQGEYAWVHFNLDDSQTATFPDINGNHTTVTGFQIFYHPAVSTRLRGGMTLQNGVNQSLDAPPSTTQ